MMPPIHPVRLISFFILFPLLILGCDLLQQQQPQYQGYRGPAPPPSAAPQPAAVAPLPAQQYNHTKTIRSTLTRSRSGWCLCRMSRTSSGSHSPSTPQSLACEFMKHSSSSSIARFGQTSQHLPSSLLFPSLGSVCVHDTLFPARRFVQQCTFGMLLQLIPCLGRSPTSFPF